jgi:hypothetical protein
LRVGWSRRRNGGDRKSRDSNESHQCSFHNVTFLSTPSFSPSGENLTF